MININISNKVFYTLIAIFIIVISGLLIYAVADDIDKNKGYHEADQISIVINGENKTLQQVFDEGGFNANTLEGYSKNEIVNEAAALANAPPTPCGMDAIKVRQAGPSREWNNNIELPDTCKDDNWCDLYIVVGGNRAGEILRFNYRTSDNTWFAYGKGRKKDGMIGDWVIDNYLIDDISGHVESNKFNLLDRVNDLDTTELWACNAAPPNNVIVKDTTDDYSYKSDNAGEIVDVPEICTDTDGCWLSFEVYRDYNDGFWRTQHWGKYTQSADNTWSIEGGNIAKSGTNGDQTSTVLAISGSSWLRDDAWPANNIDEYGADEWLFRDSHNAIGFRVVAYNVTSP